MASELAGKVAFITGGSRGIGYATAKAFVSQGASVAIVGTDQGRLDAAVGELGGTVFGVRADVARHEDVERAISTTVSRFGRLDVLVNNAGIGVYRPVAEMTVDEWDRTFATNVNGMFYCCRAALPHLRQHAGWIINISSLSSTGPFANGAAYCASKSAVNTFSDVLMQEVRYDGVRVACVLPGSVNTGFGGRANTKSEWALQPEDVAEMIVDLVAFPPRSLPSRVEIRPAQPKKA
ncbi:MAG TPA: SDR family oxidoreductase [Vicinamibacterales bacterium]|jgi:3-oxoacyl-[acyl-carrier protein] reductase|nr:SDR family oxidoreductase [Vicinamibacterales bacterium]